MSLLSLSHTFDVCLTEIEDGKKKWIESGLLQRVSNPWKTIPGSHTQIPMLWKVCSGSPDIEKIHLANDAVVDWQINYKKKNVEEKDDPPKDRSDIPYYQPSSQNRTLRDFFGHMAKNYNWCFTQSDLKGFAGSLSAVLKSLYDERLKKYVSDVNLRPIHELV